MEYVVKEDIIASIDNMVNITKGTSHVYSITLSRDFIGNQINAKKVSVISVGVLNSSGTKVLMYNTPVAPGISDVLLYADSSDQTPGIIQFEINSFQSSKLQSGNLNVQLTLVYSDFYPNAKTYILPPMKIGQILAGDGTDHNDGTDGTDTGNTDTTGSNNDKTYNGSPIFEIEHIDLDMPSRYGKMSVNSDDPALVTRMIFRNLDKNLVRSPVLENFLVNRMGSDGLNGIITINSIENPNFFTMYNISAWQRVDVTTGNGVEADSDGIEITVQLETASTGPGVLKNSWEVGNEVTFSIGTYAINGEMKPGTIQSDGILTYTDKNSQVVNGTDGQFSSTGVYISYSPYKDSYVLIEVNGISVDLGNDKDTSTVYFSGNDGATAVAIEDIRLGDQLIWNGDVAGFELEIGDDINLIYEVDVDDLP